MAEDMEQRKRLSFEQAEGIEPLPAQLQLREISPKLRAALWHLVHGHLIRARQHAEYSHDYIGKPWSTILKDEYVDRQHGMVDDFDDTAKNLIAQVRDIFERQNYTAIFGWLEFVIKHPSCPPNFAGEVEGTLRLCQAAYRVVDKKVICPIGSETEHATIVRAFADLASTQFNGARAHLRNASSHLTAGKC
ncbi:AbiJ-NTD4 domain-containing protein [Bradyrhizobium sp. WYCCWR 12699]|uniref:AbiJ-NTD4 domain-containing protein n=1 Tax=Bradyrhizobium sp. WYCCWR 12699 TaxID=3064203 RepID=UPI0028A3C215|nr:hypothetical protein [Bradyrhizobium sp. WYCCWR 12699]MDT4737072.1 hypothetical protein [Bradyrhizobium sp. WYCCWR 12699]